MTRPRNFKPGEKWPEKWPQNEWSNLKEQPLNFVSQAQRDAAYDVGFQAGYDLAVADMQERDAAHDVGFQAGYDAAVADMQAVLDKRKPR